MLANVLGPLDSAQVDHYFRPDSIQHSPMADDGSAALTAFLDWAKGAWPHYVHNVRRIMVDGDYVVVHAHTIREPGTLGFGGQDVFAVAESPGDFAKIYKAERMYEADQLRRASVEGRTFPWSDISPANDSEARTLDIVHSVGAEWLRQRHCGAGRGENWRYHSLERQRKAAGG